LINLRVGIYLSHLTPQHGGGFTFEDSLLNALMKVENYHEFYLFYHGDRGQENLKKFKYIALDEKKEKLFAPKTQDKTLNDYVLEYKIELMWFITPVYEPVQVPFIYTVWDLSHRADPYFPEVSVTGWTWESRETHYRTTIPRASCIITGTEAGKKEIIQFYQIPEERIRVLPFPTPSFVLDTKKPNKDILSGYNLPANYLFYPAQFWPHKNHIAILSALKILKEEYGLNFSVVFTGADKGNLSYIQQKVEELNLAQNVHFLGFVAQDVLVELYRNAFAMVHPTFLGPDNIPPLEAFALGCPVIASRVSGSEEQLGNAALLFNPKNEKEIAAAVKRIYEEPKLKEMLIKNGLEKADKWKAEDYIKDILEMIEDFKLIRRCWSSDEVYIHT
jgi:glycosyltransferase involved in cell wall biosynthesis